MKNLFNIYTAVSLAKLSEVAYTSDFDLDPVAFTLAVRQLGYELVSPLRDRSTDTQGFIVKNSQHAVIVFRGTMGILDINTDGKIHLVGGKHEGFLNAVSGVETQLLMALNQVGDLPVLSTGHSLGGALAKMTLLQFPNFNWLGCYTFGSPPICSEEISTNRAPIFRIVQEGDIVPRALDLNDVVYVAMIAVLERLTKIETEPGVISKIYQYLHSTWPELKKYNHLGVHRIYNREGLFLENADSIEIFNKIALIDLSRMIEDHSIVGYINVLEKAARNNIIQTEADL